MPPFQNPSPLAPFAALQANVPAFLLGSQSGPATRLQVTNVFSNGSSATVTVKVLEGPIPVVGQLVSITGTQVDSSFNVTLAPITAVSINATTGVGTIQFAISSNVASSPDAGQGFCPPILIGELPVNGNSVAYAFQTLAGQDMSWDVVQTGTALSTCTFTLQGSIDPEFSAPAVLDTTNLAAIALGPTRQVTNKQVPFVRMNLSSVTGGDSTTAMVIRIYVRYRGASS